jgi:predicted HTH domain antitoxin
VQITEDRRKQVIDLYSNQHKAYAEIAQIMKMSPRDIHAIIKEDQARRQKYEHQQHRQEISSKAYELFSEGKTSVQVATTLNLREPEVSKLHKEYWKLRGRDVLNLIHKETNGKIWSLWKLYQQLVKQRGMNISQITNIVEIAIHKLPFMETLYGQAKDQAEKMQCTIQRLANDIESLKYKLSILDKAALCSEQECWRTKQQLQELTAKKDRLEKWIANISNNDDLKQIVKENVKAALSENKQVISVAFTALLQTLTSDPKMINIIYRILAANGGEQKDNNDNAIKYLEYNKGSIQDLAEKHYENVIDVLASNAITNASSNPTLSLPSSSFTFPNLANQGVPSEIYHNNKGDIAD